MRRLTRDGTVEPVSRDQILRRERGQGNIHFPCSADHVQDLQPYPVDPYSCYMCNHATVPSPLIHERLKSLEHKRCYNIIIGIMSGSFFVFSSHSFWTSSSLDVPAGVTQEEGHIGFLFHLLSAVRALIFLARRIQPFLSLVDLEVEFCVLAI